MQKIERLQRFFDLTNQFPVWPFDALIIRKYVLSISTPIFPILIKLIQWGGMLLLKRVGISL